jgi:hypothetical protein
MRLESLVDAWVSDWHRWAMHVAAIEIAGRCMHAAAIEIAVSPLFYRHACNSFIANSIRLANATKRAAQVL